MSSFALSNVSINDKSLAVDCCKFQYIYNSLYIVKQLYLYWIALSVLNCKAPKPSVLNLCSAVSTFLASYERHSPP